jgi:hypothetical protein
MKKEENLLKTKFLQNLKSRFSNLKNGVKKHEAEWTDQPESEVTIQSNLDSIEEAQQTIIQKEEELALARKQARKLEKELIVVADTIENKAIGFHTANPDVLVDYDIKTRKPRKKKPAPSTILVPSLADDTDGVGFIVSTKSDPIADRYEWEKGIGEDPKDLTTIPKLSHYKTTTKTKFTDNNVIPGVRYFYRVRAANANGEGPWSAAVSRIQ